ncbi:MAG TPA: PadR family transcriptional regulator [Candidatus Babeliales bacterium]|nr:PadR family transcriptional regulator [Candidatus Babeliales bacterium]
MAKSNKSQFAILGMLGLLEKSSGYDLKKHMESSTEYFWKEGFSSIYPVLEDLEEQKLIVKIDMPTRSDRKRNVYAITPAGHDTLKQWLMQTPEHIQLRNELLLKVFFGDLIPVEITIEHLENYKKELKDKLASFTDIEHQLRTTNSSESFYGLITLDHGISQASSSLEWCKKTIKTLKSIHNNSGKINE